MSILIKGQDLPSEGRVYLLEIGHDGDVYDSVGRRVAAQAVQFDENAVNLWRRAEEPHWVSVKERLPPMLYQAEGDDFCIDYSLIVLAYREASHDFYLARQMDDGHGATWGTDCFDELYGVTHWMPIEPPKEDADGDK